MWNHKIYQSNPVLVKDDGPIRKYRNWYQQFYSTEQPVVKTNPNTTKPTSANDDAENEPPKHGNEPAHVEMANGIEPEKISNGLHNDLRQSMLFLVLNLVVVCVFVYERTLLQISEKALIIFQSQTSKYIFKFLGYQDVIFNN